MNVNDIFRVSTGEHSSGERLSKFWRYLIPERLLRNTEDIVYCIPDQEYDIRAVRGHFANHAFSTTDTMIQVSEKPRDFEVVGATLLTVK